MSSALARDAWQESHEITTQYYAKQVGDVKLTGEAAGRQMWYYDAKSSMPTADLTFSAVVNPNSADKVFRAQQIARWKGPRPDEGAKPQTAKQAAKQAMGYYQMIQCDDGHWAGDYGGPMFLMPGLIFSCYIAKVRPPVC